MNAIQTIVSARVSGNVCTAFVTAMVALLLTGVAANADIMDNASDQPYASSGGVWATGQNGGVPATGLNAWDLSVDPNNSGGSFFVQQSFSPIDTTHGFDGSTTEPQSWGTIAQPGYGTFAIRTLAASMSPGDTISINMKNGLLLGSGAFARIAFHPENDRLVKLEYDQGLANYQVVDRSGQHDSGVPVTFGGINAALTLTDPLNYSLTLTPFGGGTTTLTGQFLINVSSPYISFQNINLDVNGQPSTQNFNSLIITQAVPEPATIALVGLSAAIFCVRRRRPQRTRSTTDQMRAVMKAVRVPARTPPCPSPRRRSCFLWEC